MRILEVCPFSAGICGVWSRVKEESTRLAKKGHIVQIFSSSLVKGTDEEAPLIDKIEGIPIRRFNAKYLGGESFMRWNYEPEALNFAPDVIIVHNYRHLHTTRALKIARKLGKTKVFLVTHAPFVEGNITRSALAKIAVHFYDKFIGPRTLNKFDGILAISHWEIPFLHKMGVNPKKIHYIPNGIPEEFFSQKKIPEKESILYLGRIAPKKKLETLVESLPHLKEKIKVELVGPPEKEYLSFLKSLISRLKLQDRIKFHAPIYNVKEKITKIDSAKIYVLPSRVEGMPQSLIEAMARGKIVIGSNSMAIRDIIKDGQNGYLFEFNNPNDLANAIEKAILAKSKIKENAYESVKDLSWNNIVMKIEKLLTKEIKST